MKNIFTCLFIFPFLTAFAQNDFSINPSPKHKVWLYTNKGNVLKGILIHTSDSSVKTFPGTFSQWNSHSGISMINESYSNIASIKTHRKGGLIKGMLIGAGIGLSPLLVSSVFGQGEGGAYVSVAALPLGIITGAIIGGTSKKKFLINGNALRFHAFHKRVKY